MTRTLCFCLLALTLAVTVSADTLTVKQSFPLGWKYSTDGTVFHSAGFFGGGFKAPMGDDSAAMGHIRTYTALQPISFGLLGYGLVVGGWMIETYADRRWDKHEHAPLAISAGVAVLGCGILQVVADKQVKKAVEHYNSNHRPELHEPMKVKVCLLDLPTHGGLSLGLKLSF